jgi:hypothetical protein
MSVLLRKSLDSPDESRTRSDAEVAESARPPPTVVSGVPGLAARIGLAVAGQATLAVWRSLAVAESLMWAVIFRDALSYMDDV